MTPRHQVIFRTAAILLAALPVVAPAEETINTAVHARVAKGYQRERLPDGSFKPEFYALANGGRIAGTTSDQTVDRITYPEVATVALRLLAGQNYRYASNADEATLLIVLYWGTTIAFNSGDYSASVGSAATALGNLKAGAASAGAAPGQGGSAPFGSTEAAAQQAAGEAFESEMMRVLMNNRARDQANLPNARLLGYLDEINDADGIQRFAGGGDRYNDLIADVEESRYYIVVSAYDFTELVKNGKKKLQWVTRVSVRAPGNRFDDSFAAMFKGAARYFGQDSGRLIRGQESKGAVELGELKFLGEAKEPAAETEPAKESRK